jgi:NADPH:quinone reductase-like Zn-dependent oxidoreductase
MVLAIRWYQLLKSLVDLQSGRVLHFYTNGKAVFVFSHFDRDTLQFMAEAVRDGELVIPISEELPLSEAAEARAAAEKGGIRKILLVP